MKHFILFILSGFFISCSQISLEPSNFAWPIESVLDVDEDGYVQENRYSFSTNVKQLYFAENNDSTSFRNESIRIIRGILNCRLS